MADFCKVSGGCERVLIVFTRGISEMGNPVSHCINDDSLRMDVTNLLLVYSPALQFLSIRPDLPRHPAALPLPLLDHVQQFAVRNRFSDLHAANFADT